MTEAYAYAFKSDLTPGAIVARFRELGPWEWDDRDSDSWGPYYSAGVLSPPDHGIGSRPELASPWGVHDMLGEFGEFSADVLAPYPHADIARFTRQFPQWCDQHAIRGGFDVDRDSTCVYRNGIGEAERANDIKFRCVRRG